MRATIPLVQKLLNGTELAGYIKSRQAHQARSLIQAHAVQPRLAIIQAKDDPVINTYVRLKKQYGADIHVDVEAHVIDQSEAPALIKKLNEDTVVHGIIVQLPLSDTAETDTILRLVKPSKDVDALGSTEYFQPATPMAIMWLLAGYNIELQGKNILLIGQGKLVGAPLKDILESADLRVTIAGRKTQDLKALTKEADIIVTATGSPAIIYAEMLRSGTVVVDAGVASEGGKTVGDVAPDVYERDDIIITPPKGGVGPLTVCSLFENVIRAAGNQAN
ncbi:MAG: bifunctional 5,10-methylenetetrahydrofolate dehydrogenase/5,10-methenyltetrahydrofolate cyclohydrolase [Actinobacteria bacterium]|nr:bifunctional 5,10-methylenetetrahydrofolate dehydrogenase/5,10-methenyltetrahydrofolate cyclohydrolase [Actinomycetota bacterium]